MKVVHCPCGTDVAGETDDELVANVEAHIAPTTPSRPGSTRASRSSRWRTSTSAPVVADSKGRERAPSLPGARRPPHCRMQASRWSLRRRRVARSARSRARRGRPSSRASRARRAPARAGGRPSSPGTRSAPAAAPTGRPRGRGEIGGSRATNAPGEEHDHCADLVPDDRAEADADAAPDARADDRAEQEPGRSPLESAYGMSRSDRQT